MAYENCYTIINVTVLFPAKYKYVPMFIFLVQKIYKHTQWKIFLHNFDHHDIRKPLKVNGI